MIGENELGNSGDGATKPQHRTIRAFIRTAIVGFTWFVVAIKPDTPNAFYEAALVAALTTVYEYCIMYLEADEYDKGRRRIFGFGAFWSFVYLLGIIFCSFHWINLNVTTLTFSFGASVPFPDPTAISWSFYWTVYPMAVFPMLIIIESWLKRSDSDASVSTEGA